MKQSLLTFLRTIGITIHEVEKLPETGFLESILLKDGEMYILPEAKISSILHEAGHLAIIPAQFRHFASGDLRGLQQMFDALDNEPLDSPLMRAALQCGDTEATAWAYAVGVHLGIPEKLIIQDDEYSGTGNEIRAVVAIGHYLGVHGLQHAGMCNKRDWPRLIRWVQI